MKPPLLVELRHGGSNVAFGMSDGAVIIVDTVKALAAEDLYAALENLVLAHTRVHTDDAGAPASERDRAAAAFWDALHDDLGPGGLGMNSDQIRAEMLDRARSAIARARGES